ncbi:MAG: hypothetical protein ACREFR_15365 [Limisphaerales bacterium]
MDISNLTLAQLKQAANIKEQIIELESDLHSILGGARHVENARSPASLRARKNRMSAAGRARIIAAQKARWAKYKTGGRGKAKTARTRTLSASARAKIAAAARARWARAKAKGRNSL